jgi:hypothetical protein
VDKVFVLRDAAILGRLLHFLNATWKACAQSEKPLAVSVAEYKSRRSLEQNRRYWSLLREIAEQARVNDRIYTEEIWHEQCKRQFIGMEELPNGQMVGMSTTRLNVSEFQDYMTEVERYGAELGVRFSA